MKHVWIDEIKAVFKENSNRYEVHELCRPILQKMAVSEDFLFSIIRFNLSDPSFFKKTRTYPTLSLTIEDNSDFTFVVNIFPPLPDRRTDISFQSIHHHGSLLLSTVGAVGPGYRSILFHKGYTIDEASGITKMSIAKQYLNEPGKVEFVDAQQPHVVFYPASISATYALWCDQTRKAKDIAKGIPTPKVIKKLLLRLINFFHLSGVLGINQVKYFDFYVADGKIMALKNRLTYTQAGTNDNYLQNIFYFIQQTGFNDQSFLTHLLTLNSTPEHAKLYIHKLINGEPVEDLFFAGHLNVPKVNLNVEDVLKVCHD